MADDIDKTIQENLNFTMELADKIILAAGEDPHDAFIKAVGTSPGSSTSSRPTTTEGKP